MHQIFLLSVLRVILSISVSVFAEPTKKIMYEGVDITAFVDFHKSEIKTLTKGVTIYNWSANGASPFWSVDRGVGTPELTNSVISSAEVFWNSFGVQTG